MDEQVARGLADELAKIRSQTDERSRQALEDFFGQGCGSDIGWLKKKWPPCPDLSADFDAIIQKLRAHPAGTLPSLPRGADEFRYRFVGGLFSKHYLTYFDENIRRLKDELKLDASRIEVDTDVGVDRNLESIALEVQRAKSQVILVGHSKGCVDIANALTKRPELQPLVRAFIAIQPPYAGAAIATDIEASPVVASFAGLIIRDLLRGDVRCLGDLTYASRKLAVEAAPYPRAVRTLCLASTSRSPLALTVEGAEYLRVRYGKDSDGPVCVDDAFIPGASIVYVNGLDHASSVMAGIPHLASDYTPGEITQALVELALGMR